MTFRKWNEFFTMMLKASLPTLRKSAELGCQVCDFLQSILDRRSSAEHRGLVLFESRMPGEDGVSGGSAKVILADYNGVDRAEPGRWRNSSYSALEVCEICEGQQYCSVNGC